MKRHVLATLLPLLLGGCQTPSPSPVATPDSLTLTARETQAGITRLYQAGAINQPVYSFNPGNIRSHSERLTLRWDGDAVELLHTLARQRGYRFVYTGIRLPLPVNIYVTDTTFSQVLELVRLQTGWRASLLQEGVELRLHFMPPAKGAQA